MKNTINPRGHFHHELDDDEKAHITDLFFDEIVPKLLRLDARRGTINCGFAGKEYKNWNIEFRSEGSDLDIVDFHYDEDGASIDLDP